MFVQQQLVYTISQISCGFLVALCMQIARLMHFCIANRVSYREAVCVCVCMGGGEGLGGTGIPPTEIWKIWCHNYLNSYNAVYNTITKYSIIIGSMHESWIWRFLFLHMSRISWKSTNPSECIDVHMCTHRHFPLPGKTPVCCLFRARAHKNGRLE